MELSWCVRCIWKDISSWLLLIFSLQWDFIVGLHIEKFTFEGISLRWKLHLVNVGGIVSWSEFQLLVEWNCLWRTVERNIPVSQSSNGSPEQLFTNSFPTKFFMNYHESNEPFIFIPRHAYTHTCEEERGILCKYFDRSRVKDLFFFIWLTRCFGFYTGDDYPMIKNLGCNIRVVQTQ